MGESRGNAVSIAIISNGNEVSAHSFHLPEQICPIVDQDSEKYYNHFFVKIGRLQLIREGKDNITGKKRMKTPDLMGSAARARVMQIQTTQELDNLFLDDSLVD